MTDRSYRVEVVPRAARRGAYRIVFRVDDDTQLIEVLHIGHRAHVNRS